MKPEQDKDNIDWKAVEERVSYNEMVKEAQKLAAGSRIRAEAQRRNRIILSDLLAQSATPENLARRRSR
jgi:hypothetical protein